jgi:hypothetical protein
MMSTYLKVGLAINFFAFNLEHTRRKFLLLRTFSMLFPYTALFISLYKSFSNSDLAACRTRVLRSIYVVTHPSGLRKRQHSMNRSDFKSKSLIQFQIFVMSHVFDFVL